MGERDFVAEAVEFYEEHWDTLRGNAAIDALAAALTRAYEAGRRAGLEDAHSQHVTTTIADMRFERCTGTLECPEHNGACGDWRNP